MWEAEKETGNRAITQPFASDMLFSSSSCRDVSVPPPLHPPFPMCYCQAEALAVDHRESAAVSRTVPRHIEARWTNNSPATALRCKWVNVLRMPSSITPHRAAVPEGRPTPRFSIARCGLNKMYGSLGSVGRFVIYIQTSHQKRLHHATFKHI